MRKKKNPKLLDDFLNTYMVIYRFLNVNFFKIFKCFYCSIFHLFSIKVMNIFFIVNIKPCPPYLHTERDFS